MEIKALKFGYNRRKMLNFAASNMASLSEIRTSLGDDLRRMNDIISDTLRSDTPLMNTIVEQYLRVKGKQLRPMLVLLCARLVGQVSEGVLYGGAAIELLHNASLIHDDVIDQARQRRGRDTISSVWTNHIAVLVGDFFVTGALRCAVKTNNSAVLESLAQMGSDLSLGEIQQYDTARQRNITEPGYFTIIEKKTASLFVSCATIGALAAGGTRTDIDALTRWARLLGLVFQIKDDTFDYDIADNHVGKPTGNDLREGKVTLPLIYALGRTDHPLHASMNQLARKEILTTDEIAALVDYARQAGGIDYAYEKMRALEAEASELLDSFPAGDAADSLRTIFRYIIEREK